MSSADDLLANALKLPPEERHRIARELVISLDADGEDAAAAWAPEISRRLQEIIDGKVQTIDGEEAHEMLRARLQSLRRE